MLELLQGHDLTEIIGWAVTTVGGAVVVWYRKTIGEWSVFWKSVADGLREIPQLRTEVEGIRYFVSPNGGGSLMDMATRTESAVKTITDQLDLLAHTINAENDVDDGIGRFHCNVEGQTVYVNRTYANWLGIGKQDLMGWAYFNLIHPDDIERIRHLWEDCRREDRQFRATFKMVSSDGEAILFNAVATPIPEHGVTRRWIGVIRKVVQQ